MCVCNGVVMAIAVDGIRILFLDLLKCATHLGNHSSYKMHAVIIVASISGMLTSVEVPCLPDMRLNSLPGYL